MRDLLTKYHLSIRLSRRKVLLGLCAAIGLLMILAMGPFLRVQDALHKADAIVVIGGDHKPERIQRAAELYRQGYAPRIVLSAGTIVLEGDQLMPEAEVMHHLALELGLPEAALVLEQESKSTYENALKTKIICQAEGMRSILLVTSTYHSRRASRIFKSIFGPEISVSVQPARQGGCALCWPLHPDQAYVVLYEYWNWLRYWTDLVRNVVS